MSNIIELKSNELMQVNGGTNGFRNLGREVGECTGRYVGKFVDFFVDNATQTNLFMLANIAIVVSVAALCNNCYARKRDVQRIVTQGNIRTFR